MSMSKGDMITEIMIMRGMMDVLLKRAKIIFSVPDEDDLLLLRAETIKTGYKWLNDIFKGAFRDARCIWDLLPEEMWERYDQWGDCDDHTEVIVLNDKIKALRAAMKKRPDIFNKRKITPVIKALRNNATNNS